MTPCGTGKAETEYGTKGSSGASRRETHFLFGKIFCADCGSPMTRRMFTGYKGVKYKAWVCRDRHLGRNGNGCQMRIVREEELFKEICRQMRWKEVTEEKVEKIDRVEIREDGVEVVQRKYTV